MAFDIGSRGQVWIQLAAVIVLVLGAWELASRTELIDPRMFSSPSRIWSAGWWLAERGEIWPHLWITTKELLVAFVLFAIAGGGIGVLLGLRQSTFEIFYGPIAIFFAFPKVTLYPIFLMAFGLGFISKTLFAAMFGFFPLVMTTMVGVRAVRRIHIDLFDSVGASFWFRLWRLLVPGALPYFITGLRIGYVYAGIGVLLAEMFAAVGGLGNRIIGAGYQSTLDQFWVYVVVSAALLMAGAGVFRAIEVRLSHWRAA
jgi:NitT/TauT family transport system permease protein